MEQDTEQKVKIRFKFRSGEEFEAEGTPDFIERQRTQFLRLIGNPQDKPSRKDKQTNGPLPFFPPQLPLPAPSSVTDDSEPLPSFPPDSAPEEPAFLRRNRQASSSLYPTSNISGSPVPTGSDIRLWEDIVKTEDKLVILRRKNRLLTAETAALVLIAAAKTLLGSQNGYSALHLSKALAKSGYGGERLDRILAGEIRLGTVKSEGSKRSRVYLLSDEGFAKAFVLAEKLAKEGH